MTITEAIIGLLLVFYNSKNLNCIGTLSFKDLFTHFHDFRSHIGIVILVTPKHEVERKRRPRFLYEPNFHFRFMVFFTCGVLFLIFRFFKKFLYLFLRKIFLNSFPLTRSSFLFRPYKFFDIVRLCFCFVKIFVTII